MTYEQFLKDFYDIMDKIDKSDIDLESEDINYNFDMLKSIMGKYNIFKKKELSHFKTLEEVLVAILPITLVHQYNKYIGIDDIHCYDEYNDEIYKIEKTFDHQFLSHKLDYDAFNLQLDAQIFNIKNEQIHNLKNPFLHKIEEYYIIDNSDLFKYAERAEQVFNILSSLFPCFRVILPTDNLEYANAFCYSCYNVPSYNDESEIIDICKEASICHYYNILAHNYYQERNSDKFIDLYMKTKIIPEDMKSEEMVRQYMEELTANAYNSDEEIYNSDDKPKIKDLS